MWKATCRKKHAALSACQLPCMYQVRSTSFRYIRVEETMENCNTISYGQPITGENSHHAWWRQSLYSVWFSGTDLAKYQSVAWKASGIHSYSYTQSAGSLFTRMIYWTSSNLTLDFISKAVGHVSNSSRCFQLHKLARRSRNWPPVYGHSLELFWIPIHHAVM